MEQEDTLRRLITTFGTERLIAALPQREVKQALDLVTTRELAESLDVNYNTLRGRMKNGTIPFPDVRLIRRAYYTRRQAESIKREWRRSRK